LFSTVAEYVVHENNCSINAIQKEYNLGFNRAQKLVTYLETYGIVSAPQGTKAREVLVNMTQLREILEKLGLK